MPEAEAVTVQTVLLVTNSPPCLYKGMAVIMVEEAVVLDEAMVQNLRMLGVQAD
jgi:hypothetical protein